MIDPATMRIHEETLERTITVTMDLPGHAPVETTTVEARRYRFDYK